MSGNYRYYAEKTNRRRRATVAAPTLPRQLDDLFETVRRCEVIWTIEDRIERSR